MTPQPQTRGFSHSIGLLALVAAMTLMGCATASTSGGPPSEDPTITKATVAPTLPATTVASTTSTGATVPPDDEDTTCADAEMSQPDGTALTFYALCAGPSGVPYPIYRPGRTMPTLEQSIVALLEGTTPAERAIGLHTGFDGLADAGDVDVIASIDDDGVAHVEMTIDGEPWIADTAAWSSSQLLSLLDPLHATVFATPEVTGLNMATFCFDQIACDRIVTRTEWEGMLLANTGTLFHGGCTPETAWWHPDRCTVDGILGQQTAPATVTGVADDDVLVIRSGPGTEYFQHGELTPGATVAATAAADLATDSGTWILVDGGSQGVGWVNAAFLDIARTPEEELVDAFATFARNPGNDTFAELSLADEVALGLGPQIIAVVDAADLSRPDTWVLDMEAFRAYVGPFSALDLLAGWAVYEVTVGPHNHCASPPMPAPDGLEDLERVSVQPRLGLGDSCLAWGTVDFLVDPDGNVAAITLDMWEP